ncbi:MAG: CPXCG motif-containing cysteine-rich protein [Chitinophagaceae bacterium]|nr:CPXCG motif-containing cysteine-rich protein [Oligoflexus sp.]
MEEPITVSCPWCGESFITFFDLSAGDQNYIEDCQVCCRPITLHFTISRMGRVRVQPGRS